MKPTYTRIATIQTQGIGSGGVSDVIWQSITPPPDMHVVRAQFQGQLDPGDTATTVYINTQPTHFGVMLSIDVLGASGNPVASNFLVLDRRGVGYITDTFYVGSDKLANVVIVWEGYLK